MSEQLVHLEHRDDGVAVITLDNGKVNPLCVDLLDQLDHLAPTLVVDGARAVVLTGGPKVFAAGADITEFAERGGEEPFAIAPPERVGEVGHAFLRATKAIAALRCPTIAAVNGVALGGGCELAISCDFRVAGRRARFGQPEILLGIIPGGGGTQRLPRLIGPARAKDLIYSGRTVAADEALHIGLVDRLVDDAAVLDTAIDWAATLARGPRHALALAKSAMDEGLQVDLSEGLEIEQGRFVQSFTTDDARIGVQSFLTDGPGNAHFD